MCSIVPAWYLSLRHQARRERAAETLKLAPLQDNPETLLRVDESAEQLLH
jgi:hypothetical protein